MPDIPDVDIQIEGVTKLLQELAIDSHKVTGPDSIPANLLKQTALQIVPLLALIFKASVEQGKLPDDWKLAYISYTNLQQREQKISSKLSTNFPHQHMLQSISAHSSLIHLYISRKT